MAPAVAPTPLLDLNGSRTFDIETREPSSFDFVHIVSWVSAHVLPEQTNLDISQNVFIGPQVLNFNSTEPTDSPQRPWSLVADYFAAEEKRTWISISVSQIHPDKHWFNPERAQALFVPLSSKLFQWNWNGDIERSSETVQKHRFHQHVRISSVRSDVDLSHARLSGSPNIRSHFQWRKPSWLWIVIWYHCASANPIFTTPSHSLHRLWSHLVRTPQGQTLRQNPNRSKQLQSTQNRRRKTDNSWWRNWTWNPRTFCNFFSLEGFPGEAKYCWQEQRTWRLRRSIRSQDRRLYSASQFECFRSKASALKTTLPHLLFLDGHLRYLIVKVMLCWEAGCLVPIIEITDQIHIRPLSESQCKQENKPKEWPSLWFSHTVCMKLLYIFLCNQGVLTQGIEEKQTFVCSTNSNCIQTTQANEEHFLRDLFLRILLAQMRTPTSAL